MLPTHAKHGSHSSKSRRPMRSLCVVAFITLVCLFALSPAKYAANRLLDNHTLGVAGIANSTLGFGDIFVIGLRERFTRRDELALMSVATGIKFNVTDAVRGTDIHRKYIPYINSARPLSANELGCWRSHVNAWRTMLDAGLETALFLEDDVDFDVDVHAQLTAFNEAMPRKLVAMGQDPKSLKGVYPGEWDVLWFGTCNEQAIVMPSNMIDTEKDRFYVKYEDATVAPANESDALYAQILSEYNIENNHTRVIQTSDTSSCLTSYALSRQGAAKMYYALTRSIHAPIDISLYELTKSQRLTGLTVVPPIMSQWKITGGNNSDLQSQGTGSEYWNPSVGHALDVRSKGSVRHRLYDLIEAL